LLPCEQPEEREAREEKQKDNLRNAAAAASLLAPTATKTP
jgi:hypothetical protein